MLNHDKVVSLHHKFPKDMNHPLISEYIEAIKAAEDNFEQLKNLRPILGENGEPVMTSGNFAVVFKMMDEQTGKFHAVKCFLKEQEGRAEAYRMIAEELEFVNSTFLTPIKYLDKELFVDTSQTDETEFPVLLMDWVDGVTLDKYILRYRYDGYKLACLTQNFFELSKWILSQSFAHGDLKPDNILVRDDGALVLVDYDGMYVPKMFGQNSREYGTPSYRVPFNSNNINNFCKCIDDFAIIHILLSLGVYSQFPHLIDKNKDFALFSEDELTKICETTIYKEILAYNNDTNICTLLMLFQKCVMFGRVSSKDWQLLEDFNMPNRKYENMEELMCSLDNIVLAVELAYSSMLYKDPARNEFEINEYRDFINKVALATEIQENLRSHEWPYDFEGIKYSCLKPNGTEEREGIALNLNVYALRYLFGIAKYIAINKQLNNNIFGGGNDVFTLNYDENKYESYLDDFVNTLESCAQEYKFLYVFDIRNFFNNIVLSLMRDIYFENTFTNVDWYVGLFTKSLEKCSVQGLNPCSEVDFFFANLYLKSLDERMIQYDGIKYFRYGDDIRIFANDDSLLEPLSRIITSTLTPLSLEINRDKTKIINTSLEKIELAKACFVWSCRLYLGIDDNTTHLLDGKNLVDIINNGLTTTYVFNLLKEINGKVSEESGILAFHLDNLFYILKNVHKNASTYRVITELIFERGMSQGQSMSVFSYILEKTVEILNDEEVEAFVKYWILRTFFCTNKKFYKYYIDKEKKLEDDCWYPNPGYVTQMLHLLEFKFRGKESDELLSNTSDYIISYVEPFNIDDDDNELPF